MVPIVAIIVTVVPIAMPIMPAGHGHRNQAAGEEDAEVSTRRSVALMSLSYLTRSDWRSALGVPAPVVSVVIACGVGKGEAGKVSRTNPPPTTDPPTVATRNRKTSIQVFRLSLIIFHLIPPTWKLVDEYANSRPATEYQRPRFLTDNSG